MADTACGLDSNLSIGILTPLGRSTGMCRAELVPIFGDDLFKIRKNLSGPVSQNNCRAQQSANCICCN